MGQIPYDDRLLIMPSSSQAAVFSKLEQEEIRLSWITYFEGGYIRVYDTNVPISTINNELYIG